MTRRIPYVAAGLVLGVTGAMVFAQGGAQPGATASAPAPQDYDRGAIRFGVVDAPKKREGTIRLATFNVENLFDDKDDPALSGQYEDMKSVKPVAELKGAAIAIARLDADVLCLEEVESEQVLLWFRDTYLKEMGYSYARSIDAGDPRGIEQGVLSRFPITECRNWPDLPLKGVHPAKVDAPEGSPIHYHRSPLEVVVHVPESAAGGKAYDLTLMVVHQKSGRTSGYWREAEAAKTVELIGQFEKEHPEVNLAVLGDFNATPKDAAFTTFITGGLIDVFARNGAVPAPTHESGRAIDHILVNPNLLRHLGANSGFILGTPARPAGVDWRTYPAPAGYCSDHYPLAVDIAVRGEAGRAEPAATGR